MGRLRISIAHSAVAALAAVSLVVAAPSVANASPANRFMGQDLSAYYPGAGLQGMYLSGTNYLPNPATAVLWYQARDSMTFFQYNWGAPVTCHNDQLSWWPDGYLRYIRTTDACGADTTVVDYFTSNNPIILLPRSWDGKPWRVSGSSPAVVTVDGAVKCTGTNNWVSSILGAEQIAPGEYALHSQIKETTDWATGDCSGPRP